MPTATAPPRSGSDFAALSRRINEAGLMRRRPVYYAIRFSLVGAVVIAAWTTFFLLGDTWLQLLVALAMGLISGQVALLGHDLAHRQVFRRRVPSERAGYVVGNLVNGMGYGWWQDKHTRHHANPNHEELDPDVQPGVVIWSQRQARLVEGVTRFIGGYQAFLFYPLLTLEGFNLHFSGVKSVAKPGLRNRGVEAAFLAIHFAAYLTFLFTVLSPGKAVLFILVHKAVWGIYMGSIFAPNHKGMPLIGDDSNLDFLRKQVLTSRNVRGGRFTDLALGGLNYQIEHHLFPAMASPFLRQARPIVREYCDEKGIDYCETGFLASHVEALRSMHASGEPIREGRAAARV
ncbi:fatty acid desaturase family protein [Glycomyces xiaoerkulensis]|uniref:fatty acid desaturase family protein n=1 Tax=Glycomyces xiaoerkulensis TaxID=2038139 RepID=UPI000C25DF71|nr:acyl-CoA desaturase [Glycomyces xiaoerkulensis]